jgi:hypothetical protein
MSFWLREIAGWLLVLISLWVFYLCLDLLLNYNNPPQVLQAGPLVIIGIILFRGGIHLLKVAVAARICLKAQDRLADNRKPARPAAAARPAPVRRP